MANCKLITYDLDSPGQNYDKIIAAIQSYGNWAKVCESAWIVKTSNSCQTIIDYLSQYTDQNDRIFVAELTGTAWWYNVMCSDEWLKTNLP